MCVMCFLFCFYCSGLWPAGEAPKTIYLKQHRFVLKCTTYDTTWDRTLGYLEQTAICRWTSILHRAQKPPAQNTLRPGCVLYFCCQCTLIGHSCLALFPGQIFDQKQRDGRFDYVETAAVVISLVTARVCGRLIWIIRRVISCSAVSFFARWTDLCRVTPVNV